MKQATVQIDQVGRLVLPKPVRDRFRLKSGDTLAVDVRDDAIELRPTRQTTQLERVNGVLVIKGAGSIPEGTDLVSEDREDRIAELAKNALPRKR